MCILLGSDYSTFSHGLKPNEIYDLISKNECIENLLEKIKIEEDKEEFLNKVNSIRNIYFNSSEYEKILFIDPLKKSNDLHYNIISNSNNANLFSNIMLEYWDEMVDLFKTEINEESHKKSIIIKKNIINLINNKKFNIKNIMKFLKNNITDITEVELTNATISFEYLNKFGINM